MSYLKQYLYKLFDRKLKFNKVQLHEKDLLITQNYMIAWIIIIR